MALVPNPPRFLKRLVKLESPQEIAYFAEQWGDINYFSVMKAAPLFKAFCNNPTQETFYAWYNEHEYSDDFNSKPLLLAFLSTQFEDLSVTDGPIAHYPTVGQVTTAMVKKEDGPHCPRYYFTDPRAFATMGLALIELHAEGPDPPLF